jgi:hypothetical protein
MARAAAPASGGGVRATIDDPAPLSVAPHAPAARAASQTAA